MQLCEALAPRLVWRARTEATAAASEIKATAYSPEAVLGIFEGLRGQLGRLLLFLKSLRSVALFVKEAGAGAPRLLCRASLEPQV
jgi:hypothetical protein